MNLEILEFHFPGVDNVACAFTTRRGGHSQSAFAQANMSLEVGDDQEAVRANREELRRSLNFSVWQELTQVHGQDVHMDLKEDFFDGPAIKGDGLYTDRAGHGLIIKTADCQAILLTDTKGRYVGALHCGWRGNAGNFPANAVRKFCARYQVDPSQVLAVRGPSLGPGKSEFVNFSSEWDPTFRSYFDPQTRRVDLWTLTRDQLMGAGIPARNIFSVDLCTVSSDQFFSYRRERTTGRQLGLIWKK